MKPKGYEMTAKKTAATKAESRSAKKTSAKKTGRKARKAAEDKTAEQTSRPTVAEQAERSGLSDVPDAQTGKAIRRLLRKAGIYLSKDPSIGKVPVVIDGNQAMVTVNGQTFRTAVRSLAAVDES